MPNVARDATVAEIVTTHPETARVFQRHGIDFCCRGGVSVASACEGLAVTPEALFRELDDEVAARAGAAPAEDVRALGTAALIARIVDRHHGYLRRALPFLVPLSAKVASVHGAHESRLVPLAAAVSELAGMLEPHLEEEEQVLFPALTSRNPDPDVVEREFARMHEDHLAVGDVLRDLRTLTDGFVAPEWGCTSYRTLMAGLEELEGDILRHVHLENHVLMPRFVGAARAA
jgi:regulator of cell morphogenesis and NO signaling